jgi:methionyl-tRNA formyltransferase
MRIIFFGSPSFAVPSLEALYDSSHNVIAVVTQPDRPKGRNLLQQPPPVKTVAHRLKIPVLQPATTRSEVFLEEMRSFGPDLLVVVAYGEILRRSLLELPPFGAVNLHASLLPKYRGAAPIAWAILHGESVTGATTMLINETMDGGPLLLQEECPILPADTTDSLTTKIAQLGAPMLKRTVDRLEKGEIAPRPQDPAGVTYAPKLRKEDGWIDWNKSALWIARQIRAFAPWPGSFSSFRELRLKFWLAHQAEGKTPEIPGTVIHMSRHSIHVACGEGTVLEVLEIQPENRPRFTAADFIHGYAVQVGDRFSSSIP